MSSNVYLYKQYKNIIESIRFKETIPYDIDEYNLQN